MPSGPGGHRWSGISPAASANAASAPATACCRLTVLGLLADAPVSLDEPEIEGRYAELDDYTVAFETHKADMDPAPFFRGLPDDQCQCPHWGVVLSGRIIFRYPGHDEVYTTGDAYYAAAGHLPLLFAGTELVESSPTAPLNETMAVVGKNLQATRSDGA